MSNNKHGLYVARRALMDYGKRVIDGRSSTCKALIRWRRELVADLGGDVSTQQGAVIDLCCKNKLLLDAIDAWLLTQKSLINKKHKALIPVVKERQSIADGLAKYLGMLGLERVVKTKTLEEILDEGEQHEP